MSKESEKMFNLLMFKVYATNEERDRIMPWVALASIIIFGIIFLCIKFGGA